MNMNTREIELQKVVNLYKNKRKTVVDVIIGSETLSTTTEHPFYVEGKGFIPVSKLNQHDVVVSSDGTKMKIESVNIRTLEEEITVYNFEVETNHNYFVGSNSILVHTDFVCLEEVDQDSLQMDQLEMNLFISRMSTVIIE